MTLDKVIPLVAPGRASALLPLLLLLLGTVAARNTETFRDQSQSSSNPRASISSAQQNTHSRTTSFEHSTSLNSEHGKPTPPSPTISTIPPTASVLGSRYLHSDHTLTQETPSLTSEVSLTIAVIHSVTKTPVSHTPKGFTTNKLSSSVSQSNPVAQHNTASNGNHVHRQSSPAHDTRPAITSTVIDQALSSHTSSPFFHTFKNNGGPTNISNKSPQSTTLRFSHEGSKSHNPPIPTQPPLSVNHQAHHGQSHQRQGVSSSRNSNAFTNHSFAPSRFKTVKVPLKTSSRFSHKSISTNTTKIKAQPTQSESQKHAFDHKSSHSNGHHQSTPLPPQKSQASTTKSSKGRHTTGSQNLPVHQTHNNHDHGKNGAGQNQTSKTLSGTLSRFKIITAATGTSRHKSFSNTNGRVPSPTHNQHFDHSPHFNGGEKQRPTPAPPQTTNAGGMTTRPSNHHKSSTKIGSHGHPSHTDKKHQGHPFGKHGSGHNKHPSNISLTLPSLVSTTLSVVTYTPEPSIIAPPGSANITSATLTSSQATTTNDSVTLNNTPAITLTSETETDISSSASHVVTGTTSSTIVVVTTESTHSHSHHRTHTRHNSPTITTTTVTATPYITTITTSTIERTISGGEGSPSSTSTSPSSPSPDGNPPNKNFFIFYNQEVHPESVAGVVIGSAIVIYVLMFTIVFVLLRKKFQDDPGVPDSPRVPSGRRARWWNYSRESYGRL